MNRNLLIKKSIGFCLISTSLLLATQKTFAAEAPVAIPGQIEAGQIGKALSQQSSAETGVTAAPTAQPVVAENQKTALSPEAAKLSFKLTQIKVIGSTIFTPEQLAAPFRSKIGQTVTVGDIDAISKQMALKYQNAGYILTRVILPPQRIHNGVVTFQVIEGYVDKVNVTGKNLTPGMRELLQSYAHRLEKSKPLQAKDLERYALLVNTIPGISAKVVLSPSTSSTGAADLTLATEETRATGYLTTNNYGTRFLGPLQFAGGLNVNSLFRPGDSTAFQYTSTGNSQLNFAQVTNTQQLGDNGLQLTLQAYYTNTQPGSVLTFLSIVGQSRSFNGSLSYPLIMTRANTLTVNGGFNVLQSQSNAGFPGLINYSDNLRILNLGLNYLSNDSWLGTNQVTFNVNQGLHFLGASGNTNISRPNGKSGFTALALNAMRLQTLPYNFSLFLNAQSQYAFQPLLAAEQFGFGGPIIGRGYDPAEITGDQGLAGTAELRYDQPLNFLFIKNPQYYAFYDAGIVWNIDQLTQPAQQSATSTGLGVRFNFTNHVNGNIYVAKPLTRNLAAYGNKDPAVYFTVSIFG